MAIDIVMNLFQPVPRAIRLINLVLNTSQHSINMSFTPPEWQLHLQLSSLTKTMLNVSLVAGFYPFVTLLGAFYFYAAFRIDKRNLLTFFKTPPHYSYKLLEHTMFELKVSLCLFTVSTAVSQTIFLFTEPDVRLAHPAIILNPVVLWSASLIIFVCLAAYGVRRRRQAQHANTQADEENKDIEMEDLSHSEEEKPPVVQEIDYDDDYDDNDGDQVEAPTDALIYSLFSNSLNF